MADYSVDADLVKIRPNILGFGIESWKDQHIEATSYINRILESRWYKEVASNNNVDWRVTAFDSDKVDASQVKQVACYKTLELVYLYLMKDSPDADGFEREMKIFQKLYATEIDLVLSLGVNYDWDDDDTIQQDERLQPRFRRLVRA